MLFSAYGPTLKIKKFFNKETVFKLKARDRQSPVKRGGLPDSAYAETPTAK